MNEVDWARSRPSNIQHGQKRRHPLRPADAAWISLGIILAGGGVLWAVLTRVLA